MLAAGAAHLLPLGPLSAHMAGHILLMNLAAPAAALLIHTRARIVRAGGLAAATLAQIALLWAWHSPAALAAAQGGTGGALAGASLFGVALWFWLAVLGQGGAHRWRAILALLVTGKLFCLLGALMTFAPRVLYPAAHHAAEATLSDQHLAGLLMLGACPLTYVLAGVVASVRWLDSVARADGGGWER